MTTLSIPASRSSNQHVLDQRLSLKRDEWFRKRAGDTSDTGAIAGGQDERSSSCCLHKRPLHAKHVRMVNRGCSERNRNKR